MLRKYVSENPAFGRVYLKLLEHYLYSNKISEAKQYFKMLAANSESSRNAFWMLAKLYAIQDSSKAAFGAYAKSLIAGPPAPLLLSDLVDLYHQESRDFTGHEHLTAYHSKIASALFDIKKHRFREAQRKFQELAGSTSPDELVQYFHGFSHLNLGDYKRAERLWSNALAQSLMSGDRQFEVIFQVSLGALKRRQGEYSQARTYLQSALKTAEQVDSKRLKGLVLGHLGWQYTSEAKYHKALQSCDDAIKLSSRVHAYNDLALWYITKALSLFYLDKLNEVLLTYNKAEEIANRMKNEELLGLIKLQRGVFFNRLNLKDFARQEFEIGYQQAQKIGLVKQEYDAVSNFASICLADKDYSAARKIYLKLLESQDNNARPDRLAYCNLMIGETFRLEHSLEKAKDRYLLANKIAEEGGAEYYWAYSRLRLADLEVLKQNYDAAIKIYNENIIKKIAKTRSPLRVELNFGLGEAFQGKNELNQAISYYEKAASIIEVSREELTIEQFRIGYFSAAMDVYHALIRSHLELYEKTNDDSNLETLFYFLEMSRARTLLDLRFADDSIPTELEANADYIEYKKACLALQRIQRQIRDKPQLYTSLLLDYKTAQNNLLYKRLHLLNDGSHHANVKPTSLEQVIQSLETLKLGLLFYHISDEASFVLAVNGQETAVIRLSVNPTLLSASIDSLILPFHNVSETSIQNTPFRADIAHRLYKQLVKPVEEKIDLKQSLLLIPDLALSGLPFEMLLTQSPALSEYRPSDAPVYSDDFLLHRYAIMYSPSNLLAETADTVSIDPSVLIVANPFNSKLKKPDKGLLLTSRAGWRFDLLLYAEQEAEQILNIHPNSSILKRDKATKENVFNNAPNYQVLHFATHAFVDTMFDAFSGLVLATSEDSLDDGFLMGYEIADLNLNCDLVNLSACETGRGKVVAGEGVLGLPRLFLRAGAKRVLMTHWKVDDKFTSELMPKFYDGFLNQRQSKAEALKKAKLALLSKQNKERGANYEHPFYWASFTLYGAPGKVPDNGVPLILKIVLSLLVMISITAICFKFIRKRT